MREQHPLFVQYTRDWLHQVTGFSKGYLSRVATGKAPLTPSFIQRVCFNLNQPEEALFLTEGSPAQCLGPLGCAAGELGHWLEERCKLEHLSLRQAAARTGLSHATIRDIIGGDHPSAETIMKLARGFGGDSSNEMLALEDQLLVLAGYRTPRPEGKELSVPLAKLMDKSKQFSEPQLEMMVRFADLLIEIGNTESQ